MSVGFPASNRVKCPQEEAAVPIDIESMEWMDGETDVYGRNTQGIETLFQPRVVTRRIHRTNENPSEPVRMGRLMTSLVGAHYGPFPDCWDSLRIRTRAAGTPAITE